MHRTFIREVIDEVEAGYGFIPLIGSGIAVASGIPTGEDLSRVLLPYMRETIRSKWSPRTGRWLSRTTAPMSAEEQERWFLEQLRALGQKDGQGQLVQDQDWKVKLQALSASVDWRYMLQYLSRVEWDESGRSRMERNAPDPTLVDAMLNRIIEGRQPNLAHYMLAHLADGLRIRTILTTNFDDLMEQAFAALRIPLQCFDVHLDAALPSPQIVMKTRSLVKLHGGRYGLRADLTLDTPPTPADQNAFCGYFAGQFPAKPPRGRGGRDARTTKHLMVMGTSGRDGRIMGLLARGLLTLRGLKVFWLDYNRDRATQIREQIREGAARLERDISPVELERRVRVEEVSDLGPFLFELYQRRHHALPPAGASYSAISRTPANAPQADHIVAPPSFDVQQRDRNAARICRRIESTDPAAFEGVIGVSGADGVTLATSRAFEILRRDHHCLWFDLTQYRRPEDFRMALLEGIADKLGMGHEVGCPPAGLTNRGFREYMDRFLRESHKKFLVFVNAREPIGCCAGWYPPGVPSPGPVRQESFWQCFEALAGRKIGSRASLLRFVVLYRPDRRGPADELALGASERLGHPLDLARGCLMGDTDTIARDVFGLLARQRRRGWQRIPRFIYALTLFRRSRPIAALSSWSLLRAPKTGFRAVFEDKDEERAQTGDALLELLEQRGAIRFKHGGFVWMYDDVRERLRAMVTEKVPEIRAIRAQCHQGIADWYAKLFRSSNDPLAASESLYHRLCAYRFAMNPDEKATGPNLNHEWYSRPIDSEFLTPGDMSPRALARTSLQEAIHTVDMAGATFLSRGFMDDAEQLPVALAKLFDQFPPDDPGANRLARQLSQKCLCLVGDLHRRSGNYEGAIRVAEQLVPLDRRAGAQPAPIASLDQAIKRYRKAVCLTGLRHYTQAEREFRILFSHELQLTELVLSSGRPSGTGGWRRVVQNWAMGPNISAAAICLAIRALYRYTSLLVLQAQADELTNEHVEAIRKFAQVEALYAMSTTLARFADSLEFINREDVRIRTVYGVSLGNLHCPFEAHRRLNEASAYLAQLPTQQGSVAWAVIDLRRAEVYLRQAQASAKYLTLDPQRPKTTSDFDEPRRAGVLVDDAFSCLQRARGNLSAHREYVWWWTLLTELEMSACLYDEKIRCRTGRSSGGLGHWRYRGSALDPDAILEQGRLLVHRDAFRLARLVHIHWCLKQLLGEGSDEGTAALSQLRRLSRGVDLPDRRVRRYVQSVLSLTGGR
jgi:hypothetical protein